MASVALFPDNTNEAKHVESKLLPRLDEGSTPSSSTIHTERQSHCPPVKMIARNMV